jgi:exopolyphosphatase/guanosine-5'-triphosphate,3'-diphosphate pyrophosphatase
MRRTTYAAIDVGTNAARIKIQRLRLDGTRATLLTKRSPVRPGEGLYATGLISDEAADRLVATIDEYAALCRRHDAAVRAVATSALRDARNREQIVTRVRRETGIVLEIISGREEARLTCLGALEGRPPHARGLCVDIGGGSTEIALARGEAATGLWSLQLGSVRLTEMHGGSLAAMRAAAREAIRAVDAPSDGGVPGHALACSGIGRTVVTFAARDGADIATADEIARAVEVLGAMPAAERRRRFEPRRADVVVAGAVILEAVARHLGVLAVAAEKRGLRDGVLVELVRAHGRAVPARLVA